MGHDVGYVIWTPPDYDASGNTRESNSWKQRGFDDLLAGSAAYVRAHAAEIDQQIQENEAA